MGEHIVMDEHTKNVRERLQQRAVSERIPERSRAYREAAEMLPDPEPDSVVRYRALARCYAMFREADYGSSEYDPARRFVARRFMPGQQALSFGHFQADLREAVRHAHSLAVSDIEDRLVVESPSDDAELHGGDQSMLRKVVRDPSTGVWRLTAVAPTAQDFDEDAAAAGISHAKRSLAERIVDNGVPDIDGVS